MFDQTLDISEGCNWLAKICKSDLSYRTNMAAKKTISEFSVSLPSSQEIVVS